MGRNSTSMLGSCVEGSKGVDNNSSSRLGLGGAEEIGGTRDQYLGGAEEIGSTRDQYYDGCAALKSPPSLKSPPNALESPREAEEPDRIAFSCDVDCNGSEPSAPCCERSYALESPREDEKPDRYIAIAFSCDVECNGSEPSEPCCESTVPFDIELIWEGENTMSYSIQRMTQTGSSMCSSHNSHCCQMRSSKRPTLGLPQWPYLGLPWGHMYKPWPHGSPHSPLSPSHGCHWWPHSFWTVNYIEQAYAPPSHTASPVDDSISKFLTATFVHDNGPRTAPLCFCTHQVHDGETHQTCAMIYISTDSQGAEAAHPMGFTGDHTVARLFDTLSLHLHPIHDEGDFAQAYAPMYDLAYCQLSNVIHEFLTNTSRYQWTAHLSPEPWICTAYASRKINVFGDQHMSGDPHLRHQGDGHTVPMHDGYTGPVTIHREGPPTTTSFYIHSSAAYTHPSSSKHAPSPWQAQHLLAGRELQPVAQFKVSS